MNSVGANTEQRQAHDVAFSCAALLFRRERLEEILNVLPEGRRREIRRQLTELSALSVTELGKRIRMLRHADSMEAARRCGLAVHVEPLPVSLERWLHARAWESNEREDYQSGARS